MGIRTEPTLARVLIVDDQPQNILAFEAIFESLDVEIVKADSGEAALLHILQGDFAVILLAAQGPGLDALETVALIKQRERSIHIPIILISAAGSELAYIVKSYQHGVVDHLLEPIDADILRTKVSVFVELFRRSETIQRQAALLGEVKAKEAFLDLIAHELRTPLTSAKAQGQLAIRQLGDRDPETQRALCAIARQIDRLVKLVGDLFDFTRFDDGRVALDRCEFDVSALLEEQRERMQALSGDTFQIQVQAPAQLQMVADRDRIDQVLTNLLANSVRYSPNGGSVEIAAGAASGALKLTVSDHGIGIPLDQQSLIFERFGRVHGAGYGGIGLGLNIARGIVERHGGKIWVESTGVAGEGSTFHVRIPLEPAAS